MAQKTRSRPKTASKKRKIEHYTHAGKTRANNPPVGLVTPETDRDSGPKTYAYDPHLDPTAHWAGKAERISFDVPTVSLHVHERIDPRSIVEAVRKKNGEDFVQGSLFSRLEQNPPIREAIEFYKHKQNWSNRLIAGDSLLVMNSLLEKEGMAGKVQMVYVDPPYGIRYGSNFQPFVNKRDVKDGNDDDLTQEPEMIRAFRDTWELGIHSYLTYLRDRLLLASELLHESGSCFVQIGDENIHRVRMLLDEVFGSENFISLITVKKTTGATADFLPGTADYLLWYAKNKEALKFRQLFRAKEFGGAGSTNYHYVELPDGARRIMTNEEREGDASLPKGARIYRRDNLTSQSAGRDKGEGAASWFKVSFDGNEFTPGMQSRWKTNEEGMQRLLHAGRLTSYGTTLAYVRFIDDFPAFPLSNLWEDTATGGYAESKIYVVQTTTKILERCLLMTTDPGDLVLDPTCGSGTTAYVAEQWGRRWITCDTSRVAITLAKQRLMTALYEYYQLAHPTEGVGSGFVYRTVPHVTLKSIANNPEIKADMSRPQIHAAITKYAEQETLYDHPQVDKARSRVTGPFTVEAVPAPSVKPFEDPATIGGAGVVRDATADESIARSGETQRQGDWRDELLKTGIRGKGGQRIGFSRVEPLAGARWLHADAETKEDEPQRVVVSFGPEHAPLEQRQVELALNEAEMLRPKPKIVVFAAFQFDPEAAKDIDETNWPGVSLIKAQMNADLLTEDLKKKRASNDSFWLIGQPDIDVEHIATGQDKGKYRVSVSGFDYYNTKTGNIDSGGADKIAIWMLDTDYDGRSLFPRQVFFIADVVKDDFQKLARNLKAEIDPNLIQAYLGMVSLPFEAGSHKRAAIKIIDDRGIESLRIMNLE